MQKKYFQIVKKGWKNADGAVTEGLFSEAGVKYELGGTVTSETLAEYGDVPLSTLKELKDYRGNGYDMVVELTKVDNDTSAITWIKGKSVEYFDFSVGSEVFDAFKYVVK